MFLKALIFFSILFIFPVSAQELMLNKNIQIMDQGFTTVYVEANGKVKCFRITNKQKENMKTYNYWGLYLALCGDKKKYNALH